MIVNVHDAKTNLSQLLERVILGEEVIIARRGEPIARLVRIVPEKKPRVLGRHEGEVEIPDSVLFDPMPEDELHDWEKPLW